MVCCIDGLLHKRGRRGCGFPFGRTTYNSGAQELIVAAFQPQLSYRSASEQSQLSLSVTITRRKLERFFTGLEKTKKLCIDCTQKVDSLVQSIVSKGFRRELVLQNPNDEPASERLARIRASREAETVAKKLSNKKAGGKKNAKKITSTKRG